MPLHSMPAPLPRRTELRSGGLLIAIGSLGLLLQDAVRDAVGDGRRDVGAAEAPAAAAEAGGVARGA